MGKNLRKIKRLIAFAFCALCMSVFCVPAMATEVNGTNPTSYVYVKCNDSITLQEGDTFTIYYYLHDDYQSDDARPEENEMLTYTIDAYKTVNGGKTGSYKCTDFSANDYSNHYEFYKLEYNGTNENILNSCYAVTNGLTVDEEDGGDIRLYVGFEQDSIEYETLFVDNQTYDEYGNLTDAGAEALADELTEEYVALQESNTGSSSTETSAVSETTGTDSSGSYSGSEYENETYGTNEQDEISAEPEVEYYADDGLSSDEEAEEEDGETSSAIDSLIKNVIVLAIIFVAGLAVIFMLHKQGKF